MSGNGFIKVMKHTFEEHSALLARCDALPFWLEECQIRHSIIQVFDAGRWRRPGTLAGKSYRLIACNLTWLSALTQINPAVAGKQTYD